MTKVEPTMDGAKPPVLSQADAVGRGYDIYASFKTGLMRPLIDSSKATKKPFDFMGKEWLIPTYITAVEDPQAYHIGGTFMSRESLQNSFAAHVGVKASYGAFTGEMESNFGTKYASDSQYAYSYKDFYARLATLELNHGRDVLTADFRTAVDDLPTVLTKQNAGLFADFLQRWGLYYTQKVVLGGSMRMATSVAKSAQMSETTFDVMFTASYNALFASGSVDAKTKSSTEWQSFTSNSHSSIITRGGNPQKAVLLTGIDPLQPSDKTVSLYGDWVGSVQSDPAVMDFQLAGIWELCGDKRTAVSAACEAFGREMHPRLTIETSAGSIRRPPTAAAAVPPVVIMGERLKPAKAPTSPSGWQLLVLDSKKMPAPESVLHNAYYCVPPQDSWRPVYQQMYRDMLSEITTKQLNKPDNMLVLVSFGLDPNMVPTQDFYGVVRSAGAGEQMRDWEGNPDAGSQSGVPGMWVAGGINYALVGLFDSGVGTGVETLAVRIDGRFSTTMDVRFYRRTHDGQCTPGLG